MWRPSVRVLDLAGVLVRVGLAAVWLVSGLSKLADLNQSYLAVQAYEVLPVGLVGPVSVALPFVEVALGILVLLGVGTRLAAAASVLLLLVFVAGIVQAWARGLSIDCGCFGGGGQVAEGQTRYLQDLVRDIGFLLLAGWLLARPRTRWSVDGWLAAGRDADDGRGTSVGEPATDRQGDAEESSAGETSTGKTSTGEAPVGETSSLERRRAP